MRVPHWLLLLLTPLLAGWSQGTYIWQSDALLNRQTRRQELRQLRQHGMTYLMVGLNGAQVRNPSTPGALRALVQQAHTNGQQVILLLGDPAWITPKGRPQVLALIQRFRDLPLDGVHLDLEVEQLGWPVPASRLQQWIATVQAAREASPWPLSLSVHPRWFEPATSAEMPSSPCVPCALKGVDSIDLMLYQRNAKRVSERTLAIAKRWPQLSFRLAQSVEQGLPATESWRGSTASQLQTQVRQWRDRLSPAGIGGVDWQDWASYPKDR